MKQLLIISEFEACTDLRIRGSNLSTGMKAFFFHVNGKSQGYKIYMTNNTTSISLYIKFKGVNHYLQNDLLVGLLSPYRLLNLVDWFVIIGFEPCKK